MVPLNPQADFLIGAFSIGALSGLPPVLPAPMCGVTDRATRDLARQMGCRLVYTEMISAEGLKRRDEKTLRLIDIDGEAPPVGIQIFGARPESIAEAVKVLVDRGADLIDINAGCPARRVVGNDAGAALLLDLPLLGEVLRAARGACSVPLTLKFRSGWDDAHPVYLEVARMAESEGLEAVVLHPRFRSQGFGGEANWPHIAEIKQAVSIPVIGNGDIRSGADARRMVAQTGCDAVMIGRAAVGNPWLLRDAIRALTTEAPDHECDSNVSLQERLEMLLTHIRLMAERKGERRAAIEIRKTVGGYLRGVRDSRPLRLALTCCQSIAEMEEAVARAESDS